MIITQYSRQYKVHGARDFNAREIRMRQTHVGADNLKNDLARHHYVTAVHCRNWLSQCAACASIGTR